MLSGRMSIVLPTYAFMVLQCVMQFVDTLPDARLVWIEECGHVPHLEKPEQTADAISSFISSDLEVSNDEAASDNTPYVVGAGVAGVLAVSQIVNVISSF